MKKILMMAFAAVAFTACQNQTEETTVSDADTIVTAPQATTVVTWTPSEGDVAYNNSKVQVYRNSVWVDAEEDVTLDNGIVVRRTGRITRDGNEYVIEEGYTVDRQGNVWDKAGNAVEDAWTATKRGIRKAGDAIAEAAEDATDGKKNNR